MEELKSYECKKLVILSKGDELTYNSINYGTKLNYIIFTLRTLYQVKSQHFDTKNRRRVKKK